MKRTRRRDGRSRAARRGASGGARPLRPAAVRQRGLLAFAIVFAALFAIVAASEGIGHPDVPPGAVAVIEGVPGDEGIITDAEFKRGLAQSAAEGGLEEPPKPGDDVYGPAKERAMSLVVGVVWILQQGEEMGIAVSEKELAEKLERVQSRFGTKARYEKFLRDSGYTQTDFAQRARGQIMLAKVGRTIEADRSNTDPSDEEIQAYYEANKKVFFIDQATRDVQVIFNLDEKKVERAKGLLERDGSPANWRRIAEEYSMDPRTKDRGGMQKALTPGGLGEPVSAAIFAAPLHRLEGPVETPRGYFAFAVERSTPERVQSVDQARAEIEERLARRLFQEAANAFLADFFTRWRLRTFCAAGYTTERCANFEAEPHPFTAQPACYEANPKGGLPEACPAPVSPRPATPPGSVRVLIPGGQPLAQRPRPAGLAPPREE